MNPARTLQRLVTLNWEHPRRAEYSPDGRFVAYDSTKGGDRGVTTEGQLFYFETVGGSDIAITERITTPVQTADVRMLPKVGVTHNSRPAFAPDAKRLVYLAGTPQVTGRIVRIADLEGTILKDIPLERRFSTNDPPEWSPDGKKLGLRVYGSGENQLMVLSAETGAVLKVLSPLEEKGFFFPLGWSRVTET